MGRLLEEYLANNVPQLQDIVSGGQQQPEGATTFPMPVEPPPIQGQPIGPGGEPTGPMGVMPPPGGGGGKPPQGLETAPVPSFAPPGEASPTFEGPEARTEKDRTEEFAHSEQSFQGMAEKHDDGEVNKAIDAIEESGTNLDDAYAQATGGPPEKGMSRKEKGLILMEFGLNLMAQSGSGSGTPASDLGLAGMAAFKGHSGREAAKQKALVDAEDRKLERRKTEAQIAKAERADTSIETDKNGNMIIVNAQTGESKPVLMDGKPVTAEGQNKLDFEVKRSAFKAAYGSQIKDPEELERRAVAFANSVRQVAFPKLARQDQAKAIIKELNEGKNASQKFIVNGEEKRWKNMTYAEKTKTATQMVDMAMAAAEGGITSSDGAEANFGLDDEQVKGLEPNTKYKLSNDTWVAKRNGKLVEVDPPAQ